MGESPIVVEPVPGGSPSGAPASGGRGAGARVLALEKGEYFELGYRTLTIENRKRAEEDIAVLKNGTVLRTSDFAEIKGRREQLLAGVKITAQGTCDEQGNVNVSVLVPKEEVVEAIARVVPHKFGFNISIIYGEGRIDAKVEDEVTVSGRKKFVKRSDVYRYVDEKRVINAVVYKVLATELEMPIVRAKIVNGRLELYDAFDIKRKLKKLGFKWDKRCWYTEMLEIVKDYAEVVMG